ncbi:hypothetical protein IQ276_010885 [Desmonostoc muscorum LEGE 12446]|uniref:Uncharacterized protein n=1 Tax=Desmonostoc muscorum LEGE 12446 TaxID=1828758 RepID=A0A8J7A6P5_DESMC|nr:hypothetical protein [Desmonostoc muscorum]MCF2146948.1 hypothetical protein [Desmonostoc muscorum LEGE 12446]
MSPKVYAPNVHLFAFHLQKSANGDNANERDKHWLWQTCNEIIQKILQPNFDLMQWLDLDKDLDNPIVSLIKAEKQMDIAPIDNGEIYLDNNSPLLIQGFAYPLRLYDSYGLWLNLRRPENENHQRTEDVDIQIFKKLNPNNCLLLGGNENFLNQTLIITAWLSSEHDPQNQKALKTLADECLETFFPNNYPIPPFAGSATLFGSPIFEYGLFSQLTNYRHVLVWFFSHPEAEEKFNEYQEQLLDLFFFRAKVVKAFQKSREVYEDTNKEYQKIEAEINNFKQIDAQLLNDEKLDNLSQKLKTLPQMALDYANLLRYLESYQNTIAINGRNYADRLQQMRGIVKDEDISFLEKFSLENSPDFQEQIKAELGYFTHGSSLLDKAIASIRGRVEIDRAKSDRLAEDKKEISDRNLQITILAVGTGIGAGGIMSSSYSLVQNDPILQVLHTPVTNRFTAAIAYSLLFGFAIGILIWGCDQLWQSHKRKRQQ